MLKNLCGLLLLLLLGSDNLFAQANSIWSELPESGIQPTGQRQIVPLRYRTMHLNTAALKPVLAAAPLRFSAQSTENQPILEIPMPDGSIEHFRLTEAPVMHPDLQARFPEIRTYTGAGVEDPTATLKCDLTPHGFHAMILSSTHGQVYIDPYAKGILEDYIVYFKKDFISKKVNEFHCAASGETIQTEDIKAGAAPDLQGDCKLRRYRLALACTGEYSVFHGGTKPLVLAAMNTSMNRVNGVYEREVGVTMQIIPNNDLLIYLVASSDPYTNNSGSTMLGQNKTTCNNVIGTANYDMGHVFSTGGGGIASLGSVCGTNKAQGVTGGSSPIGDPFDIDYVAHEMGHQFGGQHTFNNSCGGNVSTTASYEPGSGTSIMGYAGICPPDIQNNSDDFFHGISLEQMGNFITGGGSACDQLVTIANQAPTVNAGADYIIPKNTPFTLTAVGSDPDSDPVTYAWEQWDKEISTQSPVATSTSGPNFRCFDPSPSPSRTFPRLADIIANVNPQWEKLPNVARTMHFRVTIRDNHAGLGCTEEDDMTLTIASTGPFAVTVPNTNVTWNVAETKAVTWDVASSNAAPVNCANVRILLSTDGGLTYPIVLANSVPNNGSANVVVPNNISTTCRVKVEAIGNVFFDISNQNFRIQTPPAPTFALAGPDVSVQVCAGNTADLNYTFTSFLGFSNPIQLTVAGAPVGANIMVSPNPVVAVATGSTATVSISNLTPTMAGTYNIVLTATSGTITQTSTATLNVLPGQPTEQAMVSAPANGATGVGLSPALTWQAVNFAATYDVQVATSPSFGAASMVYSGTVNGATASINGLSEASVYYWRVKPANTCGAGSVSDTWSFQTGKASCGQQFNSTNVPVAIAADAVNSVNSSLTVNVNKPIQEVKVSLQISHTYVGDLSAKLTGPDGTKVVLFDQPGVPDSQFGCAEDDMNVIFADANSLPAADLEGACSTTIPAISGTYQTIAPLAAFNGALAQGNWQLNVADNYAEDGGNIVAWGLTFCLTEQVAVGAMLTNQPLVVATNQEKAVASVNLQAQASGMANQVVYTLLSLPQHGTLSYSGSVLAIGQTFTQADIAANAVIYSNNGDGATADDFRFDVFDQNNSAWVNNTALQIQILQNTLTVNVASVMAVGCNNGNNGSLNVEGSNGTAPLQYSLNGGAAQNTGTYTGLSAGTYTVIVTDALGFTKTSGPIQITNPAEISAMATVTDDDIAVTANGGTGTLTYSLNGQPFTAANVFENLPNGVYTITVKDANGCEKTIQTVVAVNMLLAALDQQTAIACAGSSDGAVVATAAGGQLPLEYSLDGMVYQSSNVFTGLASGTYTVTVKDNLGLTTTTNPVTLTAPAAITASASASLNSIAVTANGGTGALSYSIDGVVFQTSSMFADLANGDYTITVRDANNCSTSTAATVAVPALSGDATVTTAIGCFGGLATITVNAMGGIPPYKYRIGAGAFQNSNVFTNLEAGNYVVRVRDANNTVINLGTTTVTQPTLLEATATVIGNDVSLVAIGGTAPYTFEINGMPSNDLVDNLPNGVYAISATDANGCTASTTATVDYTPLSMASQTATPSCVGIADGSISLNAVGGVPPYLFSIDGINYQNPGLFEGLIAGSYTVQVRDAAGDIFVLNNIQVNNPTPISATANAFGSTVTITAAGGTGSLQYSLDGGAFQTSANFQNVAGGQHDVTVRDAKGCTFMTSLTVLDNTLTLAGEALPTCPGTAGGTILLCIQEGYPPYTVSLTPNVGTQSPGIGICQQNIEINGLTAGNYTVKVTDSESFVKTQAITVSATPAIAVSVANDKDDLVVTSTGGTGAFEYSLDGITFQASNIFADLPNGQYTVTVRDAAGCTKTANFQLAYVGTVEPEAAWGLQVSPNPSNGLFRVGLQNALSDDLQMMVFDANGRLLRNISLAKGQTAQMLDLSDLPTGMYALRVSDGKNTGAVRLAVMR